MTVAEFLADRPDWLPEPTHALSFAAEWLVAPHRIVQIRNTDDGILCVWGFGSDMGEMVTTHRDRLLAILREIYPPTFAERIAMLPRLITGSADKQ